MGGERKQFHILVDLYNRLPNTKSRCGNKVEQAVRDNNLNASGGYTVEGQKERPLRLIARLGPSTSKVLEDLKKVPVKTTSHRAILLEHVAKIEEGAEPNRGDGSIDGNPGVVITLVKQPHVDTRGLSESIQRALRITQDLRPPPTTSSTRISFSSKSSSTVGSITSAKRWSSGRCWWSLCCFFSFSTFERPSSRLQPFPFR